MLIACDHWQMAVSLLGRMECTTGIDFIIFSDGIISKTQFACSVHTLKLTLICVKTIPFLCFIMWIETIIQLGRDLTFVLFLFKAITLAKRNLLHYIFNWNHSPEQVRCLVQWWGNKTLKIILNKISFCYIFMLILMFLELHRNNLNVFNTIITKDLNSVLLDSTLISSAFILFQKW